MSVVEGTGFWIGKDGYFVTARHVALAVKEAGSRTVLGKGVACVPQTGWIEGGDKFPLKCLPMHIVAEDVENDLALCMAEPNPFVEGDTKDFVLPGMLEDSIPADGTPVAFTGFGFGFDLPMTAHGLVASYQRLGSGGVQGQLILLDAISWPGMSGGPVYLGDGRIVGVALGLGEERFRGLAAGRPAKFVGTLLEQAHVSY